MFKSFSARISVIFFLTSALVLGAVFFFFYFRAAKLRDDAFQKHFENFIEVSANFISGEEVLEIPLEEGCDKLPQGGNLIRKLRSIRAVDPDIFDVYVMVRGPDRSTLRFVTNADRERTPVACGEPYDVRNEPRMRDGFLDAVANMIPSTDKWGTWVSAYAPIRKRTGETVAMIGVDIAQQRIMEIRAEFFNLFLLSIGACLFFSLAIGLLSSFWLTRPMRQVIQGMERVRSGDLNHSLGHFSQIEFEKIANIFNQMTGSLRHMIRELEISTRENERVRHEIEVATEIQQSIFPENPPEIEGLEIAASSAPAKAVGGDYFDFFPVGTDAATRTGFVIADAAGKGIPGTLYMTRSRSVFRVVSSQGNAPGETLSRSNSYIASDSSSKQGMFITVLYMIYDSQEKQMIYSNAGHYNPLWFKSGEKKFIPLKSGGIPVGILPGQEFPEETLQLDSGDILVMYTDGVIEAKAEDGQMFGLERLTRIIEQNSSLGAHEIFEKIQAEIRDFIGKALPFDDMTLMVLRVK
ncbi:MAG TPA: SpoIIE family protein phosphatase [Candidatus Omnitrophota bacterium]|nr:SpoIIE family protein phosphatase [Candidatus Omnitrophota bacterium]